MRRAKGLFDQLVRFDNLHLAARKAFRGKKDRGSVALFYFGMENELIQLQEELIERTYRPRPYRMFEIREPKVRKISSSDFRDRVVHHAICNLLEPILEGRAIYDSYACRVGKGTHLAIKRCQTFTRRRGYFLKCDIRKYFESIDRVILKRLLRRVVKDGEFLSLLDMIVDHQVPNTPPQKGLPIGNLTSQHFANFYLGELDHFLKDRLGLKCYLRYMDDFICFSEDKDELHQILAEIRSFLSSRLELALKEKITRIAPVTEGVPFLGFRIFPGVIRLQRENLIRFRRKIKRKEVAYQAGKQDSDELLKSINSMIAHISHADVTRLLRRDFERSLHLA